MAAMTTEQSDSLNFYHHVDYQFGHQQMNEEKYNKF